MLNRNHGRVDAGLATNHPGVLGGGDSNNNNHRQCLLTFNTVLRALYHYYLQFSKQLYHTYHPHFISEETEGHGGKQLVKMVEKILVYFSGPLFLHLYNVRIGDNLQDFS